MSDGAAYVEARVRESKESVLQFRLRLHAELTDHKFVQDVDDIPGGCATCWERLGVDEDD